VDGVGKIEQTRRQPGERHAERGFKARASQTTSRVNSESTSTIP
jgi:hypothetical protein